MKAKHAQGESCKMYPRCRKSITACVLAQKQRGFWQQWRTTIQRDGQKLFWKKRHGQILALKWAQSPILLARLKFQLASVAGQLTPLWGGKSRSLWWVLLPRQPGFWSSNHVSLQQLQGMQGRSEKKHLTTTCCQTGPVVEEAWRLSWISPY